MEKGDVVEIQGYELMAVIDYYSAPATAVVVHNHSTHFLVFVVKERDKGTPLMAQLGTFIESFPYHSAPDEYVQLAYAAALMYASGLALGYESDE